MSKPMTVIYDVATGVTIEREMTDEEHQALLDLGWTPEPKEPSDE